ncbi:hypothetical protein RCH22_003657 [Cryobacterium psychrotolerans]|nr:hypothetical protein [Cryobacterium psychrotolerans]
MTRGGKEAYSGSQNGEEGAEVGSDVASLDFIVTVFGSWSRGGAVNLAFDEAMSEPLLHRSVTLGVAEPRVARVPVNADRQDTSLPRIVEN